MGYIEETGAAQHYRDARISPIYEGTNGIQAADLVGRKLGLEGGAVLAGLLADISAEAGAKPQLARRSPMPARRSARASCRPGRTTGSPAPIRS